MRNAWNFWQRSSVKTASARQTRVIESWSSFMNVRHWLGDIGLAVLLALPTATLASPSAIWKSRPTTTTTPVHIAVPERSTLGFLR